MLQRDIYNIRPRGITPFNEPEYTSIIEINPRTYPDMYEAYNLFMRWIKLPISNFILCNGCENAIKNTLLALKYKGASSMFWHKPTWGMLDVFCEALQIKPSTSDFVYDKFFVAKEFLPADILFTTIKANNYFPHEDIIPSIPYKYIIKDATYNNLDNIVEYAHNLKENEILVGSFDKIFGAGYRLGFAISLNPEINQILHLQREQFINSVAMNLLQQQIKEPPHTYYNLLKSLSNEDVYISPYYILLYKQHLAVANSRMFMIDNKKFTRIGMPHNSDEYYSVKNLIESLNFFNRINELEV